MTDAKDPIEQIVRRPPVMIDSQLTLRKAAMLLTEESIGVAVVRGHHPPVLVSERDIVSALAEGLDPDHDHVDAIVTGDVVSASAHDTIATVGRMMLDNEVRHVPILEGDAIVGMASSRDVLAALLEA